MPTIALDTGTATRSRVSRAFLLRSPRETPVPLFMNVLLDMRWDTKPDKRIRSVNVPHATRLATTHSYA